MSTSTSAANAAARISSAAPAAATAKAIPLKGVALGIDVGGTGVKAAMVDLATAELVTNRYREKTPQPSEPAAVIETVASVVSKVLAEHEPVKDLAVGCGLPGAIKYGLMKTAANLDKSWVDFDATTAISEKLDVGVHVINDADAAGMAELAYGEARDRPGTTILLTLGTGIGSALISEGRLVPNTEFGHLIMGNQASETLVSGAARKRRELGWKRWAREFNEYLAMLEFFFWPDRIILGGGVSKESKKYWDHLETNCELVKAEYLNTSGIIGAAYAAGLATHEAAATAKASASGSGTGSASASGSGTGSASANGSGTGSASANGSGKGSALSKGSASGSGTGSAAEGGNTKKSRG